VRRNAGRREGGGGERGGRRKGRSAGELRRKKDVEVSGAVRSHSKLDGVTRRESGREGQTASQLIGHPAEGGQPGTANKGQGPFGASRL
jgi:hypothetical protein